MKQLDEKVKKVFEGQALWFFGTCGAEPDVSVIGFKELRDDGTVVLCDVMMKHALENIAKTGRASVLAVDAETMAAYQIIGSAAYETSGPVFEEWKQNADAMTGGRMPAKGVVILTPERVVDKSAGKHNGEEL